MPKNLNITKAVMRGARVGYRNAGEVFYAEFSHGEGNNVYALTLPDNGHFVYVHDDDVEEVEYGRG